MPQEGLYAYHISHDVVRYKTLTSSGTLHLTNKTFSKIEQPIMLNFSHPCFAYKRFIQVESITNKHDPIDNV